MPRTQQAVGQYQWFDFPANPTVGEVAINNGIIYWWDGRKWVHAGATGEGPDEQGIYVPIAGGTMTGYLTVQGISRFPGNIAGTTRFRDDIRIDGPARFFGIIDGGVPIAEDPPTTPLRGSLWFQRPRRQLMVHDGNDWIRCVEEREEIREAPRDGRHYLRHGTSESWTPGLPLSGGTVSGHLRVGSLHIEGLMMAEGIATFQSDVIANGNVRIGQDLTVNGSTRLVLNLTVEGNTTLARDLTVNGITTLQAFSANGNATLRQNLTVAGTTTLQGDTTTGTLVVNGPGTFNANLTVMGTTQIQDLTVNGNAGLRENLTVSGGTTLGALSVNGTANLNQSVNVGQTLVVSGTTQLNNLTLNGTFTGSIQASSIVLNPSVRGTTTAQGALQALDTALTMAVTTVIAGNGLTGGGAAQGGAVTVSLSVPVSIANGGTGATTAAAALANLGGQPATPPSLPELKTDVRTAAPGALDKVCELPVVDFLWRDQPTGKRQIGFLQPDVRQVMGEDSSCWAEGGWNLTPMIVILWQAVQELREELRRRDGSGV